jgi:hypothetical protein
MDFNTINNRGAQPLKSIIHDPQLQYGSWSITDENWDENAWDLQDVLVATLKDFGAKSLFEFNVELGMTNSSFHFISVSLFGSTGH